MWPTSAPTGWPRMRPLVRHGQPNARVSATAVRDDRELTAHLLINASGANQASINRTRLNSPRELLGVVRTVLFCPEDLALVRGEPAERRRYLDNIIATRRPAAGGRQGGLREGVAATHKPC